LFICAPFGTETQKSVALLPSPATSSGAFLQSAVVTDFTMERNF
jgi:hypothetical protein